MASAPASNAATDDQPSRVGLLELPVELLDAVFNFCTKPSLRCLALVSRDMRLASKPALYRAPTVNFRGMESFATALRSDTNIGRAIRILDLVYWNCSPEARCLFDPVPSSPFMFACLRDLKVGLVYEVLDADAIEQFRIDSRDLLLSLQACPTLRSLELNFSDFVERDEGPPGFRTYDHDRLMSAVWAGLCLPQVESFALECHTPTSPGSLANICSAFPNAWDLGFDGVFHFAVPNDADLASLGRRERLCLLRLANVYWDEEAFASMGRSLPEGATLTVNLVVDALDADARVTRPNPRLTALNLPPLDGPFRDSLADALDRDDYPQLEWLRFLYYPKSTLQLHWPLRMALRDAGFRVDDMEPLRGEDGIQETWIRDLNSGSPAESPSESSA